MQVLQIGLLAVRPFTFSTWFSSPYGDKLVNDATLAVLPALLLFLIPSQTRQGEAVLTWPVVQEKLDLGLLLLIGGSIAISHGFIDSGLSMSLGNLVGELIPRVHPLMLNLTVVASVTLCSQAGCVWLCACPFQHVVDADLPSMYVFGPSGHRTCFVSLRCSWVVVVSGMRSLQLPSMFKSIQEFLEFRELGTMWPASVMRALTRRAMPMRPISVQICAKTPCFGNPLSPETHLRARFRDDPCSKPHSVTTPKWGQPRTRNQRP